VSGNLLSESGVRVNGNNLNVSGYFAIEFDVGNDNELSNVARLRLTSVTAISEVEVWGYKVDDYVPPVTGDDDEGDDDEGDDDDNPPGNITVKIDMKETNDILKRIENEVIDVKGVLLELKYWVVVIMLSATWVAGSVSVILYAIRDCDFGLMSKFGARSDSISVEWTVKAFDKHTSIAWVKAVKSS
jgi:hypothetical protein